MVAPIVNSSFESGDFTGWEIAGNAGTVNYQVRNNTGTPYGNWALHFPDGSAPGIFYVQQISFTPVWEGKQIRASVNYSQGPASANHNTGRVVLRWYDSNQVLIGESPGTLIYGTGGGGGSQGSGFVPSEVRGTAPAGASFVKIGLWVNKDWNHWIEVDNFNWDMTDAPTIKVDFPVAGTTYQEGSEVPFRASVSGEAPVASVSYTVVDTSTSVATNIGSSTTAPFAVNYADLPLGSYRVTATATFTSGATATSTPVLFLVGEAPPEDRREYLASNAYTYLVSKNITGLSSAVPPTAVIIGLEAVVDYHLTMLARTKEIGLEDVASSRYAMAFDMIPSITFTTALFSESNGMYTQEGNEASATFNIQASDFSVVEDGTSEGHRWTVLSGDDENIIVGSATSVFGVDNLAASNLLDLAIGLKVTPNVDTKPSYASSGDASIRVALDTLRFRIYFDAGSVEYYFASPNKDMVIKGTLVSANTLDGNFTSSDASGILQLHSDLEVMDGNQQWIANDWTIHAAYPPTDANQIGDVGDIEDEPEVGMEYNGLPTQKQVKDNRSRYQMVTANFYGDKKLNSIYGANGLSRGFAYNGDWFYKIYTQPDEVKDRPRHVAYHHWHLALGYDEGRVDISVVGEPYNFDGSLGASSWTIGDQVVGLLPLSGTILGVFGSKSVWGISGTTVDNFATQVISPNIGATEYTICDMGTPVYANAYGIYTLAQTQQYGDYMGVPMSQDVSPWLRPRLVRKYTSEREVEVAWPVRSKNQYRLAFSDGYVLSMTMNGQAVPTFSKQKYFLGEVCTPGWERLGEYKTESGPSGGGWNATLEKPSRVRITSIDYWVSPNAGYRNGFILETTNDTIDIENESPTFHERFLPMPIEYDDVTAIYYAGAEDLSDATVEDSSYLVEVWRDCEGEELPTNLYEYPAIVPAAVSSQLDVTGEERIHIAPWVDEVESEAPVQGCASVTVTSGYDPYVEIGPSGMPSWYSDEASFAIRYGGTVWEFWWNTIEQRYRNFGDSFPFDSYDQVLEAEVAPLDGGSPEESEWSCIHVSTVEPV